MAAGIRQRHGNRCTKKGRCDCPWEAFVYAKLDGKKIRKTFPSKAAAIGWRRDSGAAVEKQLLRAPSSTTLEQAADAWFQAAKEGTVRNRSGDAYKPSAIRGYKQGWELRIKDRLGSKRLTAITRNDLQDLVDKLIAEGLNPSTVVVTLLPLRLIYKRAHKRGEVAIDPTMGLEMPAVRSRRERIASPEEGRKLLEAVPKGDRAIWATAMYAGLRRGELMGLHIEDVDLKAGVIRVRRGWDPATGEEIATKSRKERAVPIAGALRAHLAEHLLGLGWSAGYIFGASASKPFPGRPIAERADKAWEDAKLKRITLHECRHTFASLMIDAGVNAKALSIYMGHSTVAFTLDRYGHLMPGNEDQAAGLLDSYLASATGAMA
jgi:integrase